MSIASFSGLASGIQWQDMIDQIMAVEASRRVVPLSSQITQAQKRADAWRSYQSVITRLADAARTLREGAAFSSYRAAATTGAGGRALVNVTASSSAAPGSHKVEVLGLAKAEKLSGHVVASTTEALGLEGEFAVNGRRVEVTATDTLASIRDRINAANAGASPSRVSASILSTGTGQHRLVLSSDVAGAAGMDLADGDTGVLRRLGVVDDALVANTTATGGARTRPVSGVTSAIAAALGVTMPQPSTIRIGDRTVTVDLSVDSLASIAARIQAEGIPARTVAETVDGRTVHRLEVEGVVTADPADAAGSQRTLEVLGFVHPGRGAVSQVVAGEEAWTVNGAAATGASSLTAIAAGGASPVLQAGDVITIRGTRGDGVQAQATTFTVDASSTVDELLAQVTAAYGDTRGATASLGADGTIRLTDSQGGESRLSLSLAVSRGGTEPEAALLGRASVETAGRLRAVATGSDAMIRVDGVTVTRGGNTISDVISGVTLSLQHAEPGTEIDVSVTRDDAAAVTAVKQLATAYNDAVSFVRAQTAQGATLAFNGTLRAAMSELTGVLLTDVGGLPDGAAFGRATLVGVSLSRTGVLEVDEAKLRAALASNHADVRALFGTAGVSGSAALAYVTAGTATVPGSYDVEISALATRPSLAGSGFGGAYAATGASDLLKVTDAASGRTVEVPLADGATADQIVQSLNARFASDGLRLAASVEGGNVTITGTEYGTKAAITVEYLPTVPGSADQLGLAGTAAGSDVAGTIGGAPATGSGRTLTAAAGTDGAPNPAAGLAVLYTGSDTGPAGAIAFSRGLGGMIAQVTDRITRAGDGTIARQQESITTSITSLERRVSDAESRLELRREAMVRQFAAMEAAIARMQSQGNWLAQQVGALPRWSSRD